MWRRGRPSKVDLIGGLLAMPALHGRPAPRGRRDKYMPTPTWPRRGLRAVGVLAILVHGFGLHNRILGYALLLATA
jgi:hypothetical protein